MDKPEFTAFLIEDVKRCSDGVEVSKLDRARAVRRFLDLAGVDAGVLADALGVARSTVYRWAKAADGDGVVTPGH